MRFIHFFLSSCLSFLFGGGGGDYFIVTVLSSFLASICFVLNLYYISCLFHVH